MDLSFSPQEQAFRTEVREWIAEALPDEFRERAAAFGHFDHHEIMRWHKILADKGWSAPHWPKEAGGTGWDAARQFIFAEELVLAGTPPLSVFGLYMIGPLLMHFGSSEQKARFLPKIVSGQEVWCQGYSEPGAGSDLAALRTKAEDKGDHFLVNGQKTWTTYAQHADWIFCLVRTDNSGRKQEGISFLLIPMDAEGVKAVPMDTIGGDPAFADTFFDNVEVPRENLLGPLHGGWGLAKALLGHERTLVGSVGPLRRALLRAKHIARETTRKDGGSLLEEPAWRARIANLEMRMMAHQMANWRALADQQAGRRPGAESSILKIVASTLQQEMDELAMDLMGLGAQNWFDEGVVPAMGQWVPQSYCYNRATTIYAGSNEIQKNIIAKRILGLPPG